jgi:hypothetical protein
MRRTAVGFIFGIVVAALIALSARESSANKLDLAIGRFVNCTDNGYCWADNAAYEKFLAEYFFALAPKIMSPADTLGYSGFYVGLESTLVPINAGSFNADTALSDPWYKATGPDNDKVDAMFVPAIHVRKGLPWSFELGGSLNYLAQSEVVGIGGEVKWSLFEGYLHHFRGALPNIAARGSVVRIIGTTDLDVTIVGVDGSISKPFGIGGQVILTPYGGFQYIWTLIRTEPIIYRNDDGYHEATGPYWDTTMLSGPNLGRMKLFLGICLQYELLRITIEGGWGLKQTWDTAIDEAASDQSAFNVQRQTSVDNQFQFNTGVGMDF